MKNNETLGQIVYLDLASPNIANYNMAGLTALAQLREKHLVFQEQYFVFGYP